jgi:aerobic-type carbon monoxide dehydrogenase small subunit (CoxS/CutS family)
MARTLRLQVNGRARPVPAEPPRTLLTVLRDELELTGTKYGCGQAQCGACTVLLDRRPVRACITAVSAAAGKPVTTIEGLERGGRLHPLQAAFIEAGAMQCGYCVPGMIMSALGLLERNGQPSEAEIARALQGNICRCGTHPRIVRAVASAAAALPKAELPKELP